MEHGVSSIATCDSTSDNTLQALKGDLIHQCDKWGQQKAIIHDQNVTLASVKSVISTDHLISSSDLPS